ncbi:MAG: hypothetical protein WA742_09905, partial [Candidatus Cybelea sp.]
LKSEKYVEPKVIIFNVRAVKFGKCRYLFDMKFGPITLRDCNVVAPDPDGALKFAAPRRIRERTSNALIPVADVDRPFMNRVFAAVLERIDSKIEASSKPDGEIGGAV